MSIVFEAKLRAAIGDWITCSPEFVEDCDHTGCLLERAADEIYILRDRLSHEQAARLNSDNRLRDGAQAVISYLRTVECRWQAATVRAILNDAVHARELERQNMREQEQ